MISVHHPEKMGGYLFHEVMLQSFSDKPPRLVMKAVDGSLEEVNPARVFYGGGFERVPKKGFVDELFPRMIPSLFSRIEPMPTPPAPMNSAEKKKSKRKSAGGGGFVM